VIVVKVELWPHGDESKARPIGQIAIANDGTGTAESGNYNVVLAHAGRFYGRKGAWRRGRVTGYQRIRQSPYHLLAMAMRACGIF
jgi:hypothetical protein